MIDCTEKNRVIGKGRSRKKRNKEEEGNVKNSVKRICKTEAMRIRKNVVKKTRKQARSIIKE